MIAEILSVGTELLMGQIANTDAQYISRRLSELGVTLYRHTTVDVASGCHILAFCTGVFLYHVVRKK